MILSISLSEILELIGVTTTIIALFFAVRSFRKNTEINEAIFIKDLFGNFQRDRQAILDNPLALQILSKERGLKPEQIIRRSIGSFDLNRAYVIYLLHERKLIPKAQWERDMQDMRVLFSDDLVMERWQQLRTRYPIGFQSFIETHILSFQYKSSNHQKAMALEIVHSTHNCADTTCPTIYKDEAGNYVIQGFILKPSDKEGIQIPEGEDAIRIPADFLQEFVQKMQQ